MRLKYEEYDCSKKEAKGYITRKYLHAILAKETRDHLYWTIKNHPEETVIEWHDNILKIQFGKLTEK